MIKPETNPEDYWDLLLLADPTKAAVANYLADGKFYVAEWEGVVVGVYVLVPVEGTLWELKNIAVSEEWQGKGVGKALLAAAINSARDEGAATLEVGTGNSSLNQLAFYQKAGFRMIRIAKNFFTLNYDTPIIEGGIQCRDMVILALDLKGTET